MGTQKQDGCCKKFSKFLFSHVGLCGMVILYCVAGGFIFEHLEKNNELDICYESRKEYEQMENKTLPSILKIFREYGFPSETNQEVIEIQIKSILETFRNNSLAIGYDGRRCDLYGLPGGPPYSWSWPGALMFSVTVVSTIGYGHIAPKTIWGRLVCIAYAVLGIPLMLLCLANIGDVLADIFRFIYAKICCLGCCRGKKKKDKNKVVQIRPMQNSEGEAGWKSGGNDKVIASAKPPAQTEFSRLPTKSPTGSTDTNDNTRKSGPGGGNSTSRPISPANKIKIVPLEIKAINRPNKNDPVMLDDDSDSDDDDNLDEKKITVPLTITMIVIGGYIFGGAGLFALWQGWDLLQSAYFCFITLSTIGFGDVVPGTDFDDPQSTAQLLLGAIYVLFGMAILSMCFSLMQDEIIAKCRWVGEKLGIIDKTED